jgi:bifunctional UDP-N-acetylglucosamine pyrophosphorylase/glucosamine-1-phosphate N-acetyltransferase
MKKTLDAIILAAGKGTRMKSALPKVLHEACGMPLLYYAVSAVTSLRQSAAICVVVGYGKDQVCDFLGREFGKRVVTAEQKTINGNAKAVEAALPHLSADQVLITCGDATVVDPEIIREALAVHKRRKSDCTVFTLAVDDPRGLGRMLIGPDGRLERIVEEIDLTPEQRQIKIINTGIYIINRQALERHIGDIAMNKRKKEYFFTDIIEVLHRAGKRVYTCHLESDSPYFSVNNGRDLAMAERIIRNYLVYSAIDNGVRVVDPETLWLGPKTQVGTGTVIYPFTFLENNVKIGSHCSVGPFCRLRSGAVLEDYAEIGNFAELVRSTLGSHTKMKHVSYLGDATVGKGANIGAGAIVANFDGSRKHKTRIGNNAFVGSNSVLVAPIDIGEGGATGAGSVVTHDVAPETIVVGVPAKPLRKR